MKAEIQEIIDDSRERGWILEPDAKRILTLAGLAVPPATWTEDLQEALSFVREAGYPVVAKVVSPEVLHKSDAGGVEVGIRDDDQLRKAFDRIGAIEGCTGILIEKMVSGVEVIVGGKIDYQFGPVILLGLGGTAVEIYRDISLRMAPLQNSDVQAMIQGLKARQLLEGHRGSQAVNLDDLTRQVLAFSELVVDLSEQIESADLNPVVCSADQCAVVDARIILAGKG
jgi:hypothetical protein